MSERSQPDEPKQRSPGWFGRRRAGRAALRAAEEIVNNTPEARRNHLIKDVDEALAHAEGRQTNHPDIEKARVDLRTMSHESRVHDVHTRTLTVPGEEVGHPEHDRVGFYGTRPKDTYRYTEYFAVYDSGSGEAIVTLQPIDEPSAGGLALDGALTADYQQVADRVLETERSVATAAALSQVPPMGI